MKFISHYAFHSVFCVEMAMRLVNTSVSGMLLLEKKKQTSVTFQIILFVHYGC